MLKAEEQSLFRALENGASVEPGPYTAMVVKAILRESAASPKQLVILETT